MNLFNFDLTPDYVDRYAGVSNYDKFRKMVTKSNVDMVINKFTPFTKAKRSVSGVGTIISVDGSNIDKTDQSKGISVSTKINNKDKNIVINNETLGSQLENVHKELEFDYINSQMKMSYGCISNLTRCASFSSSYSKLHSDGDISDEYMNLIDMAHQIAKASIMGYLPDYKSLLKKMPDEMTSASSNSLAALVEDMIYGEELTRVSKLIGTKNKSSGDWDEIETEIQAVIARDIHDGVAVLNYIDVDTTIVPSVKVFSAELDNPKNDKDGKEVCNASNGQISYDESPSFSEQPTAKDKEWILNNDTLESDGRSDADDSFFFTARDWEHEERDFSKYDHLVDALYESLVGRIGKKNSQSPAKKLNKRNVASDLSDNIYISNDPVGGKKLNINVIIDTSGSMSGNYIDDAVYILYVFNELARRGVVSGKIMLSANKASGMWDFPMNNSMLQSIAAHNGGEGFKHTMAIRWAEMKAADFNIAITDGQLTDGYIDLTAFEAAGIYVTGMYVGRGMDKKNITRYTGGLKEWFSHSIVRPSVEEGVYSIVDQAILQLGSGNGN